MRWGHLIFGIALFIVFAVTGHFMRVDFPDKDIITPDLRLLMRSRHIYILFSSLVHISLGLYLQVWPQTWRRILQYSGSVILVISSVLLVWAFVFETYTSGTFSGLSRYGIVASLVGVGLHLIGSLSVART